MSPLLVALNHWIKRKRLKQQQKNWDIKLQFHLNTLNTLWTGVKRHYDFYIDL